VRCVFGWFGKKTKYFGFSHWSTTTAQLGLTVHVLLSVWCCCVMVTFGYIDATKERWNLVAPHMVPSGEYCNHGCYPTVVSNGRWASSSITQKRPQKEKMKPKRKKQLLYLIHIIRSINTKLTAVFDTREHCTPHQRALPGGWWPSKSTSSPRAILHKHKSYWKQLAQRALFPAQHRSGVRW